MKALEHARTVRRRMYAVAWLFARPVEKRLIEACLADELRGLSKLVLTVMSVGSFFLKKIPPVTLDGTTYHGELFRSMVEREWTRRVAEDMFNPGTMVGDAAADLFGDVSDAKGQYDA